MKLRSTAIALGVGAATAAGLSLLKVDKPVVIGSTAVVVGAGLILLKDEDELNADELTQEHCNQIDDSEDTYDDLNINRLSEYIEKYPVGIDDIGPRFAHLSDLYLERAKKRQQANDFNGAIEDYTKLIELVSENRIPDQEVAETLKGYAQEQIYLMYIDRANVKRISSDLNGAIDDYGKAIDIDTESSYYAYGCRGIIRGESGKQQKAIEDLDKAIELEKLKDEKNRKEYYFYRASFKSQLSDHEGAIEDYTEAMKIDFGDNAKEYLFRGFERSKLGDSKGAINDFNEVLNQYSSGIPEGYLGEAHEYMSQAYNYRASLKQESGDMKGACEDWWSATVLGKDEIRKCASEKYEKYCIR